MLIRTIKALSFWAGIAYLFYLLITSLLFLVFTHGDFVAFFTHRYPFAYRIDEYGERYFTADHHRFVADYAVGFSLFLIGIILFLIWKRRRVDRWMDGLISDIIQIKDIFATTLLGISKNEKWILLTCFLLLTIIKIYFLQALPFYVDEVFNFNYFVSQGALHSSIFANNHVLTNIISAGWWNIGLSPEWSVRLTSVLSAYVIHVLIYSFTSHYLNFKSGVFVLMLTGVSFWANVYGVEGAAYMPMTLWVLLGVIAISFRCEGQKRGTSLFVMACVFGFSTTPLFVIPFIALISFWSSTAGHNPQLKHDLKTVIVCIVAIFTFSLLLYFPMYLWSGFGATFHSGVTRYDLVFMSPALFEGFSIMTDVNTKSSYVLAALLAPAILYFRRLDQQLRGMILLVSSVIFSIVIFSIAVGVYPPSRALIFANVLFLGALGIFLSRLVFDRLQIRTANLVLCVAFLLKVASTVFIFNFGWQHIIPGGLQDRPFYEEVNALSGEILDRKPKLIFSDQRDTHLNFYLTFGAIRRKQPLEFTYDSVRLSGADVIILNNRGAFVDRDYEKVSESDFGTILRKR